MQLGAFSISLAVKNINASKDFYEKFGFTVFAGDISQNWLIMKNGDHIIGLFQGMFEKNTLTFNPGWDQNASPVESFTDISEVIQQQQESYLAVSDSHGRLLEALTHSSGQSSQDKPVASGRTCYRMRGRRQRRRSGLTVIQERADRFAVVAAHFEHLLIAQVQQVLAFFQRRDPHDSSQVDDCRAMNALERVRVEPLHEVLHGAAENMRLPLCVNAHIVAGGVYPVDVLDLDEHRAVVRLDGQLSLRTRLALRCGTPAPLMGLSHDLARNIVDGADQRRFPLTRLLRVTQSLNRTLHRAPSR